MKKAMLLIGIACLLVFAGCGNGEQAEETAQEEMKEDTGAVQKDAQQEKEATESAAAEVEKTVDAAKEKTKETVETVKKKTEKTVETAKKETEQTVETAKEELGSAVEAAREKTGEITESVQQASGVVGVMTMKNEKAFAQHRMGIVEFDHKAHAADYGLSCGKCHHDENGKPLNNLSYDDAVQSCYACHDKNGRPTREEGMSEEQWKEEQLKYYYGAIHENCMGCHKETQGPTRCTECHPRPQG